MQARCSTANICRAIKGINFGFCYCFLIAKTEEQQEALQFEMESAFVATKYWGTQSINIYMYETRPALPSYSFPFFFSRRLSRGCQSERKWRRLMQRHQVKQYSSTAGRAAPCCTELLCYSPDFH